MSCDVAVSAFLMLASFAPDTLHRAPAARLVPVVAQAENPIAREKLFAEIIKRAGALNKEVDAYRKGVAGGGELGGLDKFSKRMAELSDLDMRGHLELAKRGTDGDLKCILRGISQDLPKKLHDLMAADTPKTKDLALREIGYLLRDNVEVIEAPPAPPV